MLRAQKIAHLGIWDQDPISNELWWSDETFRILGFGPQTVTPSFDQFLKMVHPDDRDMIVQQTALSLKSDENPYNVEYRVIRIDNSERIIHEEALIDRDDTGKPIKITGIIKDITERKKSENAVLRFAEALRDAQKNAKIGSWWYDPTTQMPTWTEEMFHIFGLEPGPQALPYNEHRKIIHPEDWNRFDAAVTRAVNEGIGYNLDLRITHPNGEVRYVNARCKPEKNDCGVVTRLIGTTQDITKYKKIENELLEYRYLVEASDDGFAVIDRNHIYKLVNNRYAEMNNLRKADITGKHMRNILGDEYYEQSAKPNLEKAFNGISQQFEVTNSYSVSYKRRLLIRYYPIANDDSKIDRVAKVILDRTEQKDAEEARDRIFTLSQDLICVAGMDGYFKHLNPAWEKILGYSNKELMERQFIEFIHPDDRKNAVYEIYNLALGKITFNFENRYICKDGSIRQFLWAATPLPEEKVIYCIARDITERKNAEKLIISQAATLEAIFQASPNILAIVDIERRIKKINQKGIDFCKRKENTNIGLLGEFLCCVHTLESEGCGQSPACKDCPIKTKIMSTFATGKSHNSIEEQIVFQKDGKNTTIDMLISTNTLILEDELCVLVSLSDITPLKQAEQKNRQLQAQLLQAQKMEALGTLAGGISHDFNNILGITLGNTEYVLDMIAENKPCCEALEDSKQAIMRARDLVRQILNFSRKGDLEKQPVNIFPLVKESLKMLLSTTPASIKIESSISDADIKIMANPNQIDQILINLCTNAIHAMPGGGVLSVGLDVVEVNENDINFNSEFKKGTYVRLNVSDTGKGIATEIIPKIFDPYFTTKPIGEGTGLGLSVVYGIIQNHHGEITVNSKIGEGTTFKVYFPRIATEGKRVEAKIDKTIPKGNERILFIDDEVLMMKMGQRMLESLGYHVFGLTDPSEAIKIFKTDPSRFDLIITDMTMPYLCGDQVAAEILTLRKNIPIVLCTGNIGTIDKNKTKEIGIKALLLKPLSTIDLANTIRKILDENKRYR
jgi:PAS domain S-box-containing protein